MRKILNPTDSSLSAESIGGYPVVIPSKGSVVVTDEQAKILLNLWGFLQDGGEVVQVTVPEKIVKTVKKILEVKKVKKVVIKKKK